MSVLICGSLAYDNLMSFPDKFQHHILPDSLHMLNVCFMVPEMRREFGGCAGNIAFNLQLLGEQPLAMGTVGKDFIAYSAWLQSHQLDDTYIKVIDDAYTAQAFITTDQDNNQITFFHAGAMNYSHANAINDAFNIHKDIQLGIIAPDGREGMLQHAEQFVAANIPFVFDPGQGLPMFQKDELQYFFQQASWVIANEYEWQMIYERSGMTIEQVSEQVEAAIVTLGSAGSVIYDQGLCHQIASAQASQVIDPTGCGDAYRAGLLYGLLHEIDWQTTGQIAALIATINIESYGTQNHTFTMDEFRTRYQDNFATEL